MAKSDKRGAIKRWYILAGGSATRWGGYLGKKNKCYLEIDGEALVDRTIRLLEDNGQHNYTVVLEGYDSKREAFEGIARDAKEPFGILLGDCYYTEAIIKDAVNLNPKTWTHYYNCYPNPWTGCDWEEGYIHLVPDWEWWLEKMAEFNAKCASGEIEFKKDFQIDRYLRGYATDEYRAHELDEHDRFWCDETDDFDYPEDYDKFVAHHEDNKAGKRQDKLSIIIPTYNSAETLDKLLDELIRQKANNWDKTTEIIVVDDGSTDNTREILAKHPMIKPIYQPNRGVANARNVGLMASTGKWITFIDADDQINSDYIVTVHNEMAKGYDYCVYPWYHLEQDKPMFFFGDLIPGAAVWCYSFTWGCIGGERFDESLNVAEDLDWLKRVVTEDKKRGQTDKIIYKYDWNANPDSLSKKYNRGEIKMHKDN